MNRIFLISCVFFALLTAANAGDFYRCVDRDGNTIITDSPQSGMKKCVLKASDKEPTPEEGKAQKQRESERKKVQEKYRNNREPAPRDAVPRKAVSGERAGMEECKRACSIDRGSCEFPCPRDYRQQGCLDSCRSVADNCLDRCYK